MNKAKEALKHILCTGAMVLLFAVLPLFLWGNPSALLANASSDAVSGATLDLPEVPSGRFYVLLNESLHEDSLQDWEDFFSGRPVGIIWEDISCLAARGDASGTTLAQRFQGRLAENQMHLTLEDGMFVLSKADAKMFDCIVFSEDFLNAMGVLSLSQREGVLIVQVSDEDPEASSDSGLDPAKGGSESQDAPGSREVQP